MDLAWATRENLLLTLDAIYVFSSLAFAMFSFDSFSSEMCRTLMFEFVCFAHYKNQNYT